MHVSPMLAREGVGMSTVGQSVCCQSVYPRTSAPFATHTAAVSNQKLYSTRTKIVPVDIGREKKLCSICFSWDPPTKRKQTNPAQDFQGTGPGPLSDLGSSTPPRFHSPLPHPEFPTRRCCLNLE